MKTLIIGASGLVGNNCMRYFDQQGWDVKGTYFSYQAKNTVYFDTLNLDNTDNFDVEAFAPQTIVHCGALTFVDYCEDHQEESYLKTVISTKNVLKLAQKCNAKVVFISTDYVFDGKSGPYSEEDKVNALSVYGKHKLEAENLVKADSDKHLVLRVTNVYGNEERGKNFIARILSQIKEGKKLTLKLPQDQYATPINAYDVARCMFLLLKDHHSGIFNIASTDYMSRVQLSLTILKYFPDAVYDLEAIFTKELNQKADRPLLGGLKNHKFMNLYPDFCFSTVDDYLRKQF